MKTKTLNQLLDEYKQKEMRYIPTFNQELDEILKGGIPCGQITQLVGFPGIGKSQFCMQLCCNYQFLELLEKKKSECIYFDSSMNCSSKRLKEMSSYLSSLSTEISITSKDILKNITIIQPTDLLSLVTNIISLERESKEIKLIIIDSLPSFYKKTLYDDTIKLQTLQTLLQHLSYLSHKKFCSILIVNHLTTKEIDRNYTHIDYQLTKTFPFYFTKSLGVSFSSTIKLTLYFFQTIGETKIIIHSSYELDHPLISYQITDNGFE